MSVIFSAPRVGGRGLPGLSLKPPQSSRPQLKTLRKRTGDWKTKGEGNRGEGEGRMRNKLDRQWRDSWVTWDAGVLSVQVAAVVGMTRLRTIRYEWRDTDTTAPSGGAPGSQQPQHVDLASYWLSRHAPAATHAPVDGGCDEDELIGRRTVSGELISLAVITGHQLCHIRYHIARLSLTNSVVGSNTG